MKKLIKRYVALLALAIFLTGCQSQSLRLKSDTLVLDDLEGIIHEDINKYNIDIVIDEDEKSFKGEQSTVFKNTSGKDLNEIYFRLYPNAFKTLETAPMLSFVGDSYIGGYIDIEKLSIDGEDMDFIVEGIDETVLRIELDESLKEGGELEIYMEYFVKLPTSNDRFGYSKKTINFGNWYPVMSVYDDEGWSIDPYYNLGDPFYTDIADYDINITLDKETILASSGNILEETIKDDKKTYKIEGKLLRDFAFVTSPDFKIKEEKLDETVVKLYYLKKNSSIAEEAVKYSVDSLKVFNEHFGRYPYGQYSVVMTEFSGGMEYPGIVFIDKDIFNKNSLRVLEQIIVHETAHQWWYGIVGNNQVEEAWLDEGITSYSEVIYMDKIYGSKRAEEYHRANFQMGYEMIDGYLRGENNRVNKPLDEFSDWNDYGLLVYTKSAVFLNTIKDQYGMDTLLEILSTYYREYKFKIATSKDFLRICEEVTGESFDGMEEEWLN